MDHSSRNRLKRVLADLKEKAERWTGKPYVKWFISHGHVIATDESRNNFDIVAPLPSAGHVVYGVYKHSSLRQYDVARYVAACDPATIRQLVKDVEALKEALKTGCATIKARSVCEADFDEKELRRQMAHINATITSMGELLD